MKKTVVFVILLICQHSFAQDYRFGKVSKDELMETSHPDFPEANATVLYHNQNVNFRYLQGQGFIQTNEIHERIKIYNKEGFDEATKLIRFYNNSEGASTNNEKVTSLKGITYNLEGNDIVEYKLKKEGIFDEETNKYWKTTKFTMPNIKEGCIIEFSYKIESHNVGIDDIEFQKLIPIKKLDFRLTTPEYYNYKKLLNPRASFVPKLTTSQNLASVALTTKERTGTIITKTNLQQTKIDYKENIISADLKDIPPLIDEEFVDYLGNYQAKLIMELEYVKWPNEPITSYATTWEKVTKIIYENVDFGIQLEKKGYYDDDINSLLSGITEPQIKAGLIFNHVKSKVKWNGYVGYTTDDGVSKAYKEGTGNSAEINLMLISMLRYAGLDANPILVSTKNNGIPLLPTRSGFNYVICGLAINNGGILLDATHKFSTANILPLQSLNWMGRLIRKDGTSDWIPLTPTVISKETVSLNVKLNSDLSASGKVRNHFTEYQAFNRRDKFENFSNEQMIESLEKDKGELQVSKLVIENMYDITQPILQTYEYSFNDAMEEIGGKLYFTPLMFLAPKENPFKEDKRNYPIDFVYPIADKYIINVILPEGYIIETLPKSTKFMYNETEGAFTYISGINGSMLQITISIDLNKSLILASDYESFKEFYQLMIEKQTEKVVLIKV